MALRSLMPSLGSQTLSRAGNPFLALRQEMNRMLDDMLPPFAGAGAARGQTFMPEFDVSETDSELRIAADLPGLNEKDIDVSVENDRLIVRGERREERKEEREHYHFTERSFGSFQRVFQLPSSVEPDRITATFDKGVLRIAAPKSETDARTRKIEVSQGAPASDGKSAPH